MEWKGSTKEVSGGVSRGWIWGSVKSMFVRGCYFVLGKGKDYDLTAEITESTLG